LHREEEGKRKKERKRGGVVWPLFLNSLGIRRRGKKKKGKGETDSRQLSLGGGKDITRKRRGGE